MKQFTLAFILLALLMAPACDTLDEIELSEEPQPTFVTPVYNDNEDGTITDTTSNGVMWETCPYDFSGGTCGIGSFATKNYTDALTVCEGKTTGSYADGDCQQKLNSLLFRIIQQFIIMAFFQNLRMK